MVTGKSHIPVNMKHAVREARPGEYGLMISVTPAIRPPNIPTARALSTFLSSCTNGAEIEYEMNLV